MNDEVSEELDLAWVNSVGTRGALTGWSQLELLLENVGASYDWRWLLIADPIGTWFAQVAGSTNGLVVEVGGVASSRHGTRARLVVPRFSHTWPREDVGTFGWRYRANPGELLRPATAVLVVRSWLYSLEVPQGMTTRDAEWRMRGRGP